MIIKRIKISNYKTYLSLDLDLGVDEKRPIILHRRTKRRRKDNPF